MVTVACLLWGSWGGPDPLSYVYKLRDRMRGALSEPFRFVCFSDREIPGVDVIRFDPRFRWNLNKMILYKPGNGLEGRVLAVDLDVIPVGSWDGFASYDGRFAVCESFGQPRLAGGSIMSFEAGTMDYLWHDLVACPGKWHDRTEGSERLYYRTQVKNPDFWQDLLPGQVKSYKWHCQQGVPHGTTALVFHGSPRPHEVGY